MHYNSSEKSWSNGPNAPKIPYEVYFTEKANFSGSLVGAMSYGTQNPHPSILPTLSNQSVVLGIVVVLFFKCIGALLSSINYTRVGIKWGLVAYATAVFSFVTTLTAMNLGTQSILFVDNRQFTGANDFLPPGPLGYFGFIYSDAINVFPNIMFLLNTWLTDGLLVSPASNSTKETSNPTRPLALSLLYHLCHELLGHFLPVSHVYRVFGCVLELLATSQLHSRLTSLAQQRVLHLSTTRQHK